jgi:hypothetical protein
LIYFIGYQYYFAYLKIYALFTLHVTSWGTRAGVGGAPAKTAAVVKAENEAQAKKREEGFIQQKATMERKRKAAERTYWKGDIALLRRMHGKVGEDEIGTGTKARHSSLLDATIAWAVLRHMA